MEHGEKHCNIGCNLVFQVLAIQGLPHIQSTSRKTSYDHCKRPISEDFDLETADSGRDSDHETKFVEHNDFLQGSASSNEPQRPQYYRSGLGNRNAQRKSPKHDLGYYYWCTGSH